MEVVDISDADNPVILRPQTSELTEFQQTLDRLRQLINTHVRNERDRRALHKWLEQLEGMSESTQSRFTDTVSARRPGCCQQTLKYLTLMANMAITILTTDGYDEMAGAIVFTDLKDENFNLWYKAMLAKGGILGVFGGLLVLGTIKVFREAKRELPELMAIAANRDGEHSCPKRAFAVTESLAKVLECFSMAGMAGGTICFAAQTLLEVISAKNDTEADVEQTLYNLDVSGSIIMASAQTMMVTNAGLSAMSNLRDILANSKVMSWTRDINDAEAGRVNAHMEQAFRNSAKQQKAGATAQLFLRNSLIAGGQALLMYTTLNHLLELLHSDEEHESANNLAYVLAGAALSIAGIMFNFCTRECFPTCCPNSGQDNPDGGTRPLTWWETLKSAFFPVHFDELAEEVQEQIAGQPLEETRALLTQNQEALLVCQQELRDLKQSQGNYQPSNELDTAENMGGTIQTARSMLSTAFDFAQNHCQTVVNVITQNTSALVMLSRRNVQFVDADGNEIPGVGAREGIENPAYFEEVDLDPPFPPDEPQNQEEFFDALSSWSEEDEEMKMANELESREFSFLKYPTKK